MTAGVDLYERRNRLRIVALVVLATVNYIVAVIMASIALGLTLAIAILVEGDVGTDADLVLFFLIGVGIVAGVAILIGILVGLGRIPFLRRRLERSMLEQTGSRIVEPEERTELRNLLEGLAIASGVPMPRVAVIDDPAPNSFGVGTRPENTVIGVTSGLSERLSRPELEAVLAYEVSRIRSWDVALSSWTVALTGGAIAAIDGGDDSFLRTVLGFVPRRLGQWLQVWALRDQGARRDQVAVQFTRNPMALISALEKLDDDRAQIRRVTRSTAPLWLEFPTGVLDTSSGPSQRLARELLFDERIDHLRELTGQPLREASPRPLPGRPS